MVSRCNAKGASLTLVLSVVVLLALVGVGVMILIKMFAGGEQTQRAADVGNLGLARSALVGINYTLPSKGDQEQFNGVTDSGNAINLRNINRVMAQAFIVANNAQQMANDGSDNGASSHANQINKAAQLVADALTKQLQTSNQLGTFFNSLASQDPTAHFTGKGTLQASGTPTFAYMERGDVGNVAISAQQMPDYDISSNSSGMWKSNSSTWTTDLGGGLHFLKGYLDGLSAGSSVPNTYFVPLHPGAKPALVSATQFAESSSPAGGKDPFQWKNPVPNAISQKGSATNTESNTTTNWSANALIEPIDQSGWQAAMPHGFIRLSNGPPSAANGVAAGTQDVFVYVMNDPQYYPTDKNGKALPYFIGQNDSADSAQYLQDIIDANKNGKTPDCSALSVGVQVGPKDTIGLGGVDPSNCANITGIGNGGTPVNNVSLDDSSSQCNSEMSAWNSNDSRRLFARPVLEAAYDIPPPAPTGSNGASVHVSNIVNLSMLSQRASGEDATFTTVQSGVATMPESRDALSSPDFMVTTSPGVKLSFSSKQSDPTYPIYKALVQRIYEIYPNWNGNLNSVLSQNFVPMGGTAYIFYSDRAQGMVLKAQREALADAPWLSDFIGTPPDGKTPQHPTAVNQEGPLDDKVYNVSGDWGFPHPFDGEAPMCVASWYAFTPSSGWQNLLGVVDMGAISTNCCTEATKAQNITVNYSAGGDTVDIPNSCQCENSDGCKHTGPC